MTDMRDKIAEITRGYHSGTHEELAGLIIAALPDMVKPLEWGGSQSARAITGIGAYRIITDDDGGFGFECSADSCVRVWYWDTAEEAKGAAQDDYAARILSAFGIQADKT